MKGKNDFLPALLKEMELRRDYIGEERVDTVYFGGGTPSLLTAQELERILGRLRQLYALAPDAEITLEANPDDITLAGLTAWRAAGINRLSIGVQSFFEPDLQWMNRAHNAGQARDCIRLAQDQGFENMSIDLIYGGPTLPDDHWKYNVEQAIGLNIPHLSCYALTVEPKTALDTLIRRHRVSDVNPDDQARQFLLLMQWTANAGYEHYEISNFALPGKRSRHNSSYWQGSTYLGLGPSAHSFDGISRQWNVANNAKYSAALNAEPAATYISDKEVLTTIQQLNEYIMISLRTVEGIDLRYVTARFGTAAAGKLEKHAQRYVQDGKMIVSEKLSLTTAGRLLADGIAADLFFE